MVFMCKEPKEQAKKFVEMCKDLGVKPELPFKEQFPSLKDKRLTIDGKLFTVKFPDRIEHVFRETELRENCLDKQKVKDAILNIMTRWNIEDITCTCENCKRIMSELAERDKLLKELGLE